MTLKRKYLSTLTINGRVSAIENTLTDIYRIADGKFKGQLPTYQGVLKAINRKGIFEFRSVLDCIVVIQTIENNL
jgi:hypothetical protein